MIRGRDRKLSDRLSGLRAPDEAAAEERAWEVVREAYSERTPVRPNRRHRRLALAVAGGLAVIAIGLSPAGAKVGDLVSDVVGVGDEDARPELRSLPAAGELLVEAEQGTWIVRDDGSKRLLGAYSDAAWSPNGRYVAAADGSNLLALDPSGEVQWSLPTAGPPSDIAWEGSKFQTRIAYRAGGDLYVVGGDGIGNHAVASDVAPGAPLWIEAEGPTKVDPVAPDLFPYLLAFADRRGVAEVISPDTGEPADLDLRRAERRALAAGVAVDPIDERRAARVERAGDRSSLVVADGGRERTVFSGPGRITDPVWSPDGRWLVFGWRKADQWVFVQPEPRGRVIGIERISQHFGDEEAESEFPRVEAWILPDR